MIFDTDVNIVITTRQQYIVLPKCSHIEVDPVRDDIRIEWHDVDNISFMSNILFRNQWADQLFIIEFIQNDNKRYYCGRLIDITKASSSSVSPSYLQIILAQVHLTYDDFKGRIESMINALASENVAITPYNRMFDPNVFETKIYNIVRVPVMSDIFYNAPYTTVKWMDGTTTTVKAGADDEFNKEYGLSMAIAKKYYECLEAPNPRAAFKKAAYKDAHDQTEKTAKRRAYKEEKKHKNKRGKNGRIPSSKKSSKG